jgi:cathepsin A (carboxypeptidase C)
MSVFYSSIFPSLSKQPLYIAGESFGGRYVPAYTRYIIDQQKAGRNPNVPAKIESLVLVSAAIDSASTALGQVDHFCSPAKAGNGFGTGFNATACNAMKRAVPTCERQGQACRDAVNLSTCRSMNACSSITDWFGKGVGPGGNNPYDGKASSL